MLWLKDADRTAAHAESVEQLFRPPAGRPWPPVHAAFCARETQLNHSTRTWIGRRIFDRSGRPLGWVADVLVEERSLEETIEDGDGIHAWAVRPLFAIVRLGFRLGRPVGPSVFVPIDEISDDAYGLRRRREGSYIRSMLRLDVPMSTR